MLNPLFDISRIESAIKAGALILTPNLRLARKMTDAWNQHRLAQGDTSWPAPPIQALSTWLDDCWQQLVDGAWPAALTGVAAQPLQEQWLWEHILAADETAAANPGGFADLARRGWRLVREWELPQAELVREPHQGAQALVRWGLAWEREMAAHGLLDSLQRALIVREAFASGELPRQPHIFLAGFQSISPLHQDILNMAGHQLASIPPPALSQPPRAVSAADPDQEIIAAARWALACAQRNPAARIGIVVPDLTTLRAKVERIFLHHFDPLWCWPSQAYRPVPFNISAALPLADQALVAAALELLALNHQRLPLQHLVRVINCPLWGEYSREGPLRAKAQRFILENGTVETPTRLLRHAFQLLESGEPPGRDGATPGARLVQLADSLRHSPAKCAFSHWRQLFERQLNLLGWPGERPLDSFEYQLHEHWLDLLNELESLDRVSPPVTVTEALAHLRRLAVATPFQAETPDSQVQILGTLEAAGLQFDHLWILQTDDRHWPEATSPHPLLPVALQRHLQMPHASPARELALGRALFSLFTASGKEVIFSYARQDGDIHLQPSALLADLDATPTLVEDPYHPWTSLIIDSARLDVLDDSQGPPLSVPDNLAALPRAGSLLTAQANCPFNAFARFRLGAEPLPQAVTGLSPMARGNLVHYSLEALWRDLPDQQALLALGEEERHQRINTAIDTAFASFLRQLPFATELSERHLALEKTRIARLLDRWLNWELERQPFIVEGLELHSTLNLEGLGIHMRIDRLDRHQNGGAIIIDYKTGNTTLNGLTGERLLSPQLALYALAMNTTLDGLGYGLINSKNIGFAGLVGDGNSLPGSHSLTAKGLPSTWTETLELWHNQLKEIKNEVLTGTAAVVFFSREAAAYGGDLEPLNRWPGRDRLRRFKTRYTEVQP